MAWGDSDHIKKLKEAEAWPDPGKGKGKGKAERWEEAAPDLKALKAAEAFARKQAAWDAKAAREAAKVAARVDKMTRDADRWEATKEWKKREAEALAGKRAAKEAAQAAQWETPAAVTKAGKLHPSSYVVVVDDNRGGGGGGCALPSARFIMAVLLIMAVCSLAMLIMTTAARYGA